MTGLNVMTGTNKGKCKKMMMNLVSNNGSMGCPQETK